MGKTTEPHMNDQSEPEENTVPPQAEENATPPQEESNALPPQEEEKPASKPRRKRSATRSLAHMSIMQMTMFVVLALFLWQWFDAHRQIDQLKHGLAQRLSEMDGNNKANLTLVKQQQESMRELASKVDSLETQYAETQNQRTALTALYQDMSGNRDETVLAEVEQILMVASQQLQFSANVKAALIAMQQADERLRRMDRPALQSVRKILGRDMEKLRALPDVDVQGINAELDGLIASVDALPLTQEVRMQQEQATAAAPVAGENAWQKLLRDIWEQARHLVLIENTQKRELPLLAPDEIFFLRENLKLRLLSARLALLSRDNTSYQQELKTAQQWVARYFDTKSAGGAEAVAALGKLRAASISIELPDITGSLDAVRNYRASLAKSAR